MDFLAKYSVPFKGLKDGIHEYEFILSKEFFDHFTDAEEFLGELMVKVTLEKKSLVMPVTFKMEGTVNVACDRCLERFDLPIEGEASLFIKFGQEKEVLADDVIVLPETESELKLAQHFYELFSLSLPLKIVHPDDENGYTTCNQEMIQKIEEHSVQEEESTDPRWNELKKLLDNN